MDYEKKYKKALDIARKCHDTTMWLDERVMLKEMFPELAMSDDKKSKNWILEYLYDGLRKSDEQFKGQFKAAITWLEKQGDTDPCSDCTNDKGCVTCEYDVLREATPQPTNKVEPKFKVGDWITEGYNLWRIIGIKQLEYILQSPAVNDYIPFVDKTFHLWTIHDAKDGDLIYVSTELKGIQAIFHKFENGIIYFHCSLCSDFTQGGYMPIRNVELVNPLLQTQHQRFFQKMQEAGYQWDAEKKELKKI